MNKHYSLLTLILFTWQPVFASGEGCEQPDKDLSNDQIKYNRELIKSDQTDPLDKANAIETLMCDKRATIRGLAIHSALNSDDSFIRGKILTEILFQKQRIIIELLPEKNLTKEIKNWLKENPAVSFPITAYDREKSCLGLHYRDCNRSYVLDISGTKVDIHYSQDFGKFVLDSDGVLIGEYFPKKLGSGIKAKIQIY